MRSSVPDPLLPGSSSTFRTISATPTITSRPIRCRRRRISCRNGTFCRSTRSCVRSRTSSAASSHVRRDPAASPSCPGSTRSPVRSANYRPVFRIFFWLFVATVIGLGYFGSQPPEAGFILAGRILTISYFSFFFIVLPLLGMFEKPEAAAGLHRRGGARPNRHRAKPNSGKFKMAHRMRAYSGRVSAGRGPRRPFSRCRTRRHADEATSSAPGGGPDAAAPDLELPRGLSANSIRRNCGAASSSITASLRATAIR